MAGETPQDHKPELPRSPWFFAGTGLQVAASIALGVALGVWIDRRLDSAPWGILAGGLLGMAVGLYTLIRSML